MILFILNLNASANADEVMTARYAAERAILNPDGFRATLETGVFSREQLEITEKSIGEFLADDKVKPSDTTAFDSAGIYDADTTTVKGTLLARAKLVQEKIEAKDEIVAELRSHTNAFSKVSNAEADLQAANDKMKFADLLKLTAPKAGLHIDESEKALDPVDIIAEEIGKVGKAVATELKALDATAGSTLERQVESFVGAEKLNTLDATIKSSKTTQTSSDTALDTAEKLQLKSNLDNDTAVETEIHAFNQAAFLKLAADLGIGTGDTVYTGADSAVTAAKGAYDKLVLIRTKYASDPTDAELTTEELDATGEANDADKKKAAKANARKDFATLVNEAETAVTDARSDLKKLDAAKKAVAILAARAKKFTEALEAAKTGAFKDATEKANALYSEIRTKASIITSQHTTLTTAFGADDQDGTYANIQAEAAKKLRAAKTVQVRKADHASDIMDFDLETLSTATKRGELDTRANTAGIIDTGDGSLRKVAGDALEAAEKHYTLLDAIITGTFADDAAVKASLTDAEKSEAATGKTKSDEQEAQAVKTAKMSFEDLRNEAETALNEAKKADNLTKADVQLEAKRLMAALEARVAKFNTAMTEATKDTDGIFTKAKEAVSALNAEIYSKNAAKIGELDTLEKAIEDTSASNVGYKKTQQDSDTALDTAEKLQLKSNLDNDTAVETEIHAFNQAAFLKLAADLGIGTGDTVYTGADSAVTAAKGAYDKLVLIRTKYASDPTDAELTTEELDATGEANDADKKKAAKANARKDFATLVNEAETAVTDARSDLKKLDAAKKAVAILAARAKKFTEALEAAKTGAFKDATEKANALYSEIRTKASIITSQHTTLTTAFGADDQDGTYANIQAEAAKKLRAAKTVQVRKADHASDIMDFDLETLSTATKRGELDTRANTAGIIDTGDGSLRKVAGDALEAAEKHYTLLDAIITGTFADDAAVKASLTDAEKSEAATGKTKSDEQEAQAVKTAKMSFEDLRNEAETALNEAKKADNLTKADVQLEAKRLMAALEARVAKFNTAMTEATKDTDGIFTKAKEAVSALNAEIYSKNAAKIGELDTLEKAIEDTSASNVGYKKTQQDSDTALDTAEKLQLKSNLDNDTAVETEIHAFNQAAFLKLAADLGIGTGDTVYTGADSAVTAAKGAYDKLVLIRTKYASDPTDAELTTEELDATGEANDADKKKAAKANARKDFATLVNEAETAVTDARSDLKKLDAAKKAVAILAARAKKFTEALEAAKTGAFKDATEKANALYSEIRTKASIITSQHTTLTTAFGADDQDGTYANIQAEAAKKLRAAKTVQVRKADHASDIMDFDLETLSTATKRGELDTRANTAGIIDTGDGSLRKVAGDALEAAEKHYTLLDAIITGTFADDAAVKASLTDAEKSEAATGKTKSDEQEAQAVKTAKMSFEDLRNEAETALNEAKKADNLTKADVQLEAKRLMAALEARVAKFNTAMTEATKDTDGIFTKAKEAVSALNAEIYSKNAAKIGELDTLGKLLSGDDGRGGYAAIKTQAAEFFTTQKQKKHTLRTSFQTTDTSEVLVESFVTQEKLKEIQTLIAKAIVAKLLKDEDASKAAEKTLADALENFTALDHIVNGFVTVTDADIDSAQEDIAKKFTAVTSSTTTTKEKAKTLAKLSFAELITKATEALKAAEKTISDDDLRQEAEAYVAAVKYRADEYQRIQAQTDSEISTAVSERNRLYTVIATAITQEVDQAKNTAEATEWYKTKGRDEIRTHFGTLALQPEEFSVFNVEPAHAFTALPGVKGVTYSDVAPWRNAYVKLMELRAREKAINALK
ncbi:MAG: hypothetical protein H6850_02490 [Alphaproteobacteria bacterium]|nr:MAG: hypothetical protein H6850_02490 [Alphaproteobacteria bacterium]